MSFPWLSNSRQSQILPAVVTEEARLSAAKAVDQIAFVCRSYGISAIDGNINDLKADIAVMLANSDLESIRLELIDGAREVVFAFELTFAGTAMSGRPMDSAEGVEVPIDKRLMSLVKDKRLVVNRRGKEALYKSQLKIGWGPAATLKKSAGTDYDSEHTAAITRGRQAAKFHVSDAARHRLVVTQVGTLGFFFAKDLDLDRDGIFVLKKHLPPAFNTRIGAKFTALVIATPRGLQARSVQAG